MNLVVLTGNLTRDPVVKRVAKKGKEGKITKVLDDKVVVEGVNVAKKHLKPKNNNGTGEIVEVERPIHKSNVMIVDPKTKKPTKIKIDFDKNGKKIRISKKSNEKID